MVDIDRRLIDKLIADYDTLGVTIHTIDALYPKDVTLNLKPTDSIQLAVDSLVTSGGIINLSAGFYNAFTLKSRSKLITINGVGNDSQVQGFVAGNNTGNIAFNNLAFVKPTRAAHIQLGGDKVEMNTPDKVPSGFFFSNVSFTGPARRGIMANCENLVVDRCVFREYYAVGQDSQAIIGWNGCNNHIIKDTDLQAASENIMYGGSDAATEDMYPKNILIEYCTMTKLMNWKTQNYNMKALFELKNVQGLKLVNCYLNSNYQQAWGNAPAIVIKSANQEGGNLNARSENILIENNKIRNVGTYVLVIGRNDAGKPSGIAKNINIHNNIFEQMSAEPDGRAFAISGGPINLNINHNTVYDNRHSFVEFYDVFDNEALQIQNNIGFHGIYGLRPPSFGVNDAFHHNVLQKNVGPQPTVKLGPTNTYVDDVRTDLSSFVTSDGVMIGANQ